MRRICRDAGLIEAVKWGHPCYMHADRNIAIMGAYRSDFRLSFFNAALLQDSEGVLERQGANARHPDTIRFTATEQVEALAPVIHAYLKEAMGHAQTGRKSPKDESEIALPDELVEALDADSELGEAFRNLTRGRQKSYAIALVSAKKPETRIARIDRFRDRIMAGKGAMEL